MKNQHVFLISFIFPFAYGLAWLVALFLSSDMANLLYEYHIGILWLAMPWSYIFIPISNFCNELSNTFLCNSISIIGISAGLAFNVTMLKLVLCWLHGQLSKKFT
ncbi:hypothetical protein K6Y31_21670 [Motilimonas cestriensis]|uniref:Uncharacterized protein n=1 Tax=Motilimonas cestriensis TaxID=2742685 RepID=A0ABS8WGC8_9GAMM|nr:hypothetical protein [Motilimonas cestriensis]MCE2597383.1 hypothetical protein [Motilimonas cestriensis]